MLLYMVGRAYLPSQVGTTWRSFLQSQVATFCTSSIDDYTPLITQVHSTRPYYFSSMECSASADHRDITPTRLQIALALAVLKSKPDRVSVRGKDCLSAVKPT